MTTSKNKKEARTISEDAGLDTAASEACVHHAHGRPGREEAPRGRRVDLRAQVRRLPGADHQGRPASRASIQEAQRPRRDVPGDRGGVRLAVEGRPGGGGPPGGSDVERQVRRLLEDSNIDHKMSRTIELMTKIRK